MLPFLSPNQQCQSTEGKAYYAALQKALRTLHLPLRICLTTTMSNHCLQKEWQLTWLAVSCREADELRLRLRLWLRLRRRPRCCRAATSFTKPTLLWSSCLRLQLQRRLGQTTWLPESCSEADELQLLLRLRLRLGLPRRPGPMTRLARSCGEADEVRPYLRLPQLRRLWRCAHGAGFAESVLSFAESMLGGSSCWTSFAKSTSLWSSESYRSSAVRHHIQLATSTYYHESTLIFHIIITTLPTTTRRSPLGSSTLSFTTKGSLLHLGEGRQPTDASIRHSIWTVIYKRIRLFTALGLRHVLTQPIPKHEQ